MIDEDRTMQLFGYRSSELKPKSGKPIVRVCDNCGKYKVIPKQGYRDLCLSCTLHDRKSKIILICYQCKGEYKVHYYRKNNSKFCSHECKGKWMSKNITGINHHLYKSKLFIGSKNPNWKGGISFEPYCSKFNNQLKQSIRSL